MTVPGASKAAFHDIRTGAAAALLATTALGLGAIAIPTAAFAQETRSYDIPAGSLAVALNHFGEAAGVELIYDSALTQGLSSPGLKGSFGTAEALSRLLAGTGLTYRQDSSGAFTLERAPSGEANTVRLGPVRITGEAAGSASFGRHQGIEETATGPVDGYVAKRTATGSKTDVPIIEVPQTINVVTADQIQAFGAQSVGEALRYTPGMRVEGYGANSPFDTYTQSRGFRVDTYLDGLRGSTYGAQGFTGITIEPWMLERVEVLKGPASGLYGQSAPGGLINLVSKRPTERAIREVQFQLGNFGRVQGGIDVGGQLTGSGELLGRITALARDSDSQVDHVTDNRIAIAPTLAWRPSADTSLTLLGNYQREKGVWSFFNYLPAAGSLEPFNGQKVSTRTFLGEPDFNRLNREQFSAGYEFEHRFSPDFALVQNLRYSKIDYFMIGAFTFPTALTGTGTLSRIALSVDTKSEVFAVDNQGRFAFQTGGLAHEGVIGLDYRQEDIANLAQRTLAPTLNVFAPVYGAPVSAPTPIIANYTSKLRQVGIYAQDQVKAGNWILTLGGRYDWAETDYLAIPSPSSTITKHNAFSGRVGVTYVTEAGLAPYASYATSFQPLSGIDSSTGRPFKPSKGKQFEVGLKYQPTGSNTLATVSVFHLTQTNNVTFDDLFVQRQLGEVRVKGFEAEIKSQILPELNLIAGYAYLDHKITKSARAIEVGRALFSTPKHQASLWADYGSAALGFNFGAGVRYVGSTVDLDNLVRVPGFTLVDLRASYELGAALPDLDGLRLAFNVTNAFDKTYVSQCDGAFRCTYGGRRTLLGTIGYRW